MAVYLQELQAYKPRTPREEADKALVLYCTQAFGSRILDRACLPAHLTASGFVLNQTLDRVLMVHHNIYKTWAWTGGHADNEENLLAVAMREVTEETGIDCLKPMQTGPASIESLTVAGHMRRGIYVPDHLHLNFTYLMTASASAVPRPRPGENTAAAWLEVDKLEEYCKEEPRMAELYRKLVGYAHEAAEL